MMTQMDSLQDGVADQMVLKMDSLQDGAPDGFITRRSYMWITLHCLFAGYTVHVVQNMSVFVQGN